MIFHMTPGKGQGGRGSPPAWPFIGMGMALAAVGVWVLSLLPARFHPACGFHAVTGHPCPTCGATRSLTMVLYGHWEEAFLTSPLFALTVWVLLAWVAVGAMGWIAGRRFTIEIPRKEQKWWWLFLLAAFLGNWVYIWMAGI